MMLIEHHGCFKHNGQLISNSIFVKVAAVFLVESTVKLDHKKFCKLRYDRSVKRPFGNYNKFTSFYRNETILRFKLKCTIKHTEHFIRIFVNMKIQRSICNLYNTEHIAIHMCYFFVNIHSIYIIDFTQ